MTLMWFIFSQRRRFPRYRSYLCSIMLKPPHPAILVPDIIEEIFVHLRPYSEAEGNSGENWAALARAALVCKAFREPATRSLWWAIPGFEPVLQFLAATSLLSMSEIPTTDSSPRVLYAAVSGTSRTQSDRFYNMAVSRRIAVLPIHRASPNDHCAQ